MRKSGRKQTTNFISLDEQMLEKGVVSSDQNFKAVSYSSEINFFSSSGLRKEEVKIDFSTSGSHSAPPQKSDRSLATNSLTFNEQQPHKFVPTTCCTRCFSHSICNDTSTRIADRDGGIWIWLPPAFWCPSDSYPAGATRRFCETIYCSTSGRRA